jgi:alkylhydroperoxidase/carboxymuconolactone decarboxylase family protein YurZ
MAISDAAVKNHDELFPGHVSTLRVTDPELIEYFDNFAFDHYTRTGIDVRTRELFTFAVLISLGGCEPQAKGHVAADLNVGNGRDVLLAVITQLLPFIGYPRSLNALRVLNEVTSR